jgi:uncharacterized protein (DUF2249 family)
MPESIHELDVRALAPSSRHSEIFGTFEALKTGEGFVLVNDHDPKPLLYQFQAEHPGRFEWSVLEAGPQRFRIEIRHHDSDTEGGRMRMRACMVGLLMTLLVTACAGKRIPTTFTDMGKRVPEGTTVYVTTTDGKEVQGKLAAVSVSSIQLLLRDTSTRDFREADVTRIRAKDPLWNGMLIGAGVVGFFSFALNDASCIEPYASPSCVKVSRGRGIAIGAAIGAALGAGIDMLHRRRVFRGTSSRRGASLFIAPVVTPKVLGVRVSSGF